MENISEKSKPKRGRPRSFLREYGENTAIKALYPDITTAHGRTDNAGYLWAVNLLLQQQDLAEYAYLLGAQFLTEHGVEATNCPKRAKKTILAALGRVRASYADGDKAMLLMAGKICERELATQDAVNYIRSTLGTLEPATKRTEDAFFRRVVRLWWEYKDRLPANRLRELQGLVAEYAGKHFGEDSA